MKIKEGFMLRKMNEINIVVPVGKEVKNFNGYIQLNETGTFFWEQLSKGCTKEELISAILNEYDITEEIATQDVETFIDKLTKENLLEV